METARVLQFPLEPSLGRTREKGPAVDDFCDDFAEVLQQIIRALPKHLSTAFLNNAHARDCRRCQEAYARVVGHVVIAYQETQQGGPK